MERADLEYFGTVIIKREFVRMPHPKNHGIPSNSPNITMTMDDVYDLTMASHRRDLVTHVYDFTNSTLRKEVLDMIVDEMYRKAGYDIRSISKLEDELKEVIEAKAKNEPAFQ